MTAFSKIAKRGKLTLGIVFPLDTYSGSVPNMEDQEQLALRAEEHGFKDVRSVDLHDSHHESH